MIGMLDKHYYDTRIQLEESLTARKKQTRIILEIRAGVGGAEGSLFAKDLLNMYLNFAIKNKWKNEIIQQSKNSDGGIKSIRLEIRGIGAEKLFWESGVHRVQRIPKTESKGRIHTSAASVVIREIPERIAIVIKNKDITIDRFRASGAGGQHVNTTDSAIRITHIPSGIVVQCQDQRSQLENIQRAKEYLKIRLYEHTLEEQNKKITSYRRQYIKSGDRTDKIRTYNFPQSRVTDHRIKKKYSLTMIIAGNISKLLADLQFFHNEKTLQQLKKSLQ